MSGKTCPVCGCGELTAKKEIKSLRLSYGGLKEVETQSYYCSVCEAEGDLFDENESLVLNALEEMKVNSIKNILEDFQSNKISMSAMERALSLPMRTLTKWKNGSTKPSSTGIALLKYIRTFPWLLEVAENDFDYNMAQKTHLSVAMNKFINSMNFNSEDFLEAGIVTTSKSMFFYMQYDKNGGIREGFPKVRNVSDSWGSVNSQITTSV